MGKVILINMPFASIGYPSLALSLLKPLIENLGFPCDIGYLNIAFRAHTNEPDIYDQATGYTVVGDWVFSKQLFQSQWDDLNSEKIDSVDQLQSSTPDETVNTHLSILRSKTETFLDECMNTINWEDYDIIGFSSVYAQQVSSLALAHRIKQQWPNKTIALGGPNCDGISGEAIMRLFPFVDWVFHGEADLSFPAAVSKWFSGEQPEGVAGVSYRHNGNIIEQGYGQAPDLNDLPYASFDDYFAALKRWAPSGMPFIYLSLELSRGCWWGAKHQCSFCGLNRRILDFRSKTPERAEEEIRTLTTRHNIANVSLTDSILSMDYFNNLLPALAENNGSKLTNLFVETKANLNRRQMSILKSAGVNRFQPGIESLDTEMLDYMHKGTTLLQNVQILKWAREYSMVPSWHILFGFPGENPEPYYRMSSVIPSIVHLHPPRSSQPITIQRFSPIFEYSKEWGLSDIKAHASYRSIYPFDQSDLDDLAYNFECNFNGKGNIAGYTAGLEEEVRLWRQCWSHQEPPLLAFERHLDGRIVIYDTRPCRITNRIELKPDMAMAYLACDSRRSFNKLARDLREQMASDYCGDIALRDGLDELVSKKLMLQEGDMYLSLANDLELLNENNGSMLAYLLTSKREAA